VSVAKTARAWWSAARPLAQGNIAPALGYGEAIAYSVSGHFDIVTALYVGLFGILDHLFIVFSNDVADSDSDAQNGTFNVFSGGSRVLPEGRLTKRTLARAAIAMGLTTLLVAVVVAVRVRRPELIGLGVAAIALLLAYSFRPIRLSYRGGGELLQGLGIGVVLPAVGFFAQAPHGARFPLLALVPTFVLGVAGNITTALPDAPSDSATGKSTWPVRRGERTARRDILILLGFVVASTPFVAPGLGVAPLTPLTLFAIMIPPLVLILGNLRELDCANAVNREACLRFVTRSGLSIGYVHVAWTLALFSAGN
jgi:1,4-dihydroxy-2-naphthoate polyprenyltransferase